MIEESVDIYVCDKCSSRALTMEGRNKLNALLTES